MKRIKRKQLKEDEFVSTINKIVRFVKERTKELAALVVLIAALLLIFAGIKYIMGENRKKESRLLTQILNLRADLNNNPENVAQLEELAGDGKFSRLAYLLLATYYVENGDNDKAQGYLEKIPESRKDTLYYQAQDLLAQIHFKRKDYDKAIEIYKKIEDENPKDHSLDVILFHRAEVHEEKGEFEEALALYKKVQEEFSQTFYGFDAAQKIRKLETKK
ncbi:MAG: tetratricopeptide repeat protein [Candidatus Aminicenantes bacterium]|nr:tetratricopeptide repeat protein [Candidatus Aminicenantes bacterium]